MSRALSRKLISEVPLVHTQRNENIENGLKNALDNDDFTLEITN